jgi:hypothetical protein
VRHAHGKRGNKREEDETIGLLYEKERTLGAKHVGLKQGAIGNILGEHIGNLKGTHWELEGNMLGTKGKMKRIHPSPPPPRVLGFRV